MIFMIYLINFYRNPWMVFIKTLGCIFPKKDVFFPGKCGSSYIYVPVTFLIVLYVLQLIEAYHCQLRRDLRTKTGCERGRQLLDKYRAAYPIIWWRVICYHYAKRSRQTTSYRNGDAYVTTQDYYERVRKLFRLIGSVAISTWVYGVESLMREGPNAQK